MSELIAGFKYFWGDSPMGLIGFILGAMSMGLLILFIVAILFSIFEALS